MEKKDWRRQSISMTTLSSKWAGLLMHRRRLMLSGGCVHCQTCEAEITVCRRHYVSTLLITLKPAGGTSTLLRYK